MSEHCTGNAIHNILLQEAPSVREEKWKSMARRRGETGREGEGETETRRETEGKRQDRESRKEREDRQRERE